MTMKKLRAFVGVAALWAGCGEPDDAPREMAGLRPGVEDSSQAFKGSPSPNQADFWAAVRDADDAARNEAAADLKVDAADDPTDGYSAFLAAAHAFMPNQDLLRALADGKAIPEHGRPGPDTVPLLEQAMANFTDPLYLGFSAALLAGIQSVIDPAAAQKTREIAISNNFPATMFGKAAREASVGDAAGALATLTSILDFCEGSPIDREQPDVAGYVARANAAELAHRECYSGYRAPHGTEGVLLMMGDLLWTTGEEETAELYYAGLQDATSYPWWPWHDLAERRLAGTQPVEPAELGAVFQCTTCHVNEIAP